MDVLINGEVSEEPTDKKKENTVSVEQSECNPECDNAVCNPEDELPNKNLLVDAAQPFEKDISDGIPHNTSNEKNIPQDNCSSDNLIEQRIVSNVESNHITHLTSDADSNQSPKNELSETNLHSEEKLFAGNVEESDSASVTVKESFQNVNTSEDHNKPQPSIEPVESKTENSDSTISSDNKFNTCEESISLINEPSNSIKNCENSITPLFPSDASDVHPPKNLSNFCDELVSNSSKDTDTNKKMPDMSDSVASPTAIIAKEFNNNMYFDSKNSISEVVSNNCDSNPLEQLNQHLKSIGTHDNEPINSLSETNAQDAGINKNESSKTNNKEGSVDRIKESDSFVFTEISKEETGFPDKFTGLVVIGKYISVKGDFTLRSSEALVESPSLIAPYLLKEPDSFPPRLNDSKLEQRDFFHSAAGEMLIGIGLSRVSEWYHRDMTRIKKRQMKKEGKNPQLEDDLKLHESFYNESRKANKTYSFPLKTCENCGFATESSIVMEGHLLVPHVNMRREYQCNFCNAFNRDPKAILEHMYRIHGKTGRIQPPVLFFECPYCTFESNSKVKLGNHLPKCQRFYDPNRNQAPPKDFEFPALTPKPITVAVVKAYEKSLSSMQRGRGRPKKIDSIADQLNMNQYSSSITHSPLVPTHNVPPYRPPCSTPSLSENLPTMSNQMIPPMPMPNMNLRPTHSNMGQLRPGLPSPMHLAPPNRFYQVVNSSAQLMPMLGNNPLVSSPSQFPYSSNLVNTNNIAKKTPTSVPQFMNSFFTGGLRQQNPPKSVPEVTITPLPKLHGPYPVPIAKPTSTPSGTTSSLSTSSSSPSSQSNNLVVCEICDGYIKDLEQLRSHMQLIHKVKIHPKMLVSRPPLNCQKCQWRFFTDQGLERHLLGSHGLVTSNMQELANKSKDAGCCTICGRVYASKLVSHMNQVHKLTLKPAHLSYKCTVCSATFNLYRLFENHVYLVHSGAAKRPADGSSNPSKKFKSPCGDNNDLNIDGEPKNHADKRLMDEGVAKCINCGIDFRKHAAQIDKCEKCLKYDISQGTLTSKMS